MSSNKISLADTMLPKKSLPHNGEMEAQLLGALMTDNPLLMQLYFLNTEHFYVPVHQRIFVAIQKLIDEGRMANPMTLKQQFDCDSDLKDIGGAAYLARCVGASCGVFPVESARHMVELAQSRTLIEALEKAKSLIETGTTSPGEVALDLAGQCESIATGIDDFKLEPDRVVSERIVKDLAEISMPVSTGLGRLDVAMDGGIYPGKSYGFAAKKKTGKTVMAGTISCNLNLNGIKHLFICGEMSPEEVQQRNLARLADVYPSAFRSEYGKSQDFQNKIALAAMQGRGCILYRNAPGLTFEKLKRIITRAIHQHRIKGVILDYWQLVGGKVKGQSTAEHLDEVAQWIADTCRKHKIWSVVMAQINQEGNTRGGEGIRLAFDQVYQMHRLGPDSPKIWLEMMDTRYTAWRNIGSAASAGLEMNEKGPYFEEA